MSKPTAWVNGWSRNGDVSPEELVRAVREVQDEMDRLAHHAGFCEVHYAWYVIKRHLGSEATDE